MELMKLFGIENMEKNNYMPLELSVFSSCAKYHINKAIENPNELYLKNAALSTIYIYNIANENKPRGKTQYIKCIDLTKQSKKFRYKLGSLIPIEDVIDKNSYVRYYPGYIFGILDFLEIEDIIEKDIQKISDGIKEGKKKIVGRIVAYSENEEFDLKNNIKSEYAELLKNEIAKSKILDPVLFEYPEIRKYKIFLDLDGEGVWI